MTTLQDQRPAAALSAAAMIRMCSIVSAMAGSPSMLSMMGVAMRMPRRDMPSA